MQKTYEIDPARLEDVDEIVALVNSAYRGDSSKEGWTTEADFLDGQRVSSEMLRDEIKAGHVILCLRESANAPILACVSLQPREDGSWYLGMLTVSPKHQAGGVGRVLLERAEGFARERGCARMMLSVIQLRESLMAWYERRGYRRTGETMPFPYGNPEFGIPKREDLYFVMFEKELR